ncbi:unnamed protein product [Dracunculus medinensis]|uniref:BHLH domain-containing protein n=1 Tax=Dracunculus medinensis TaxID=318479 RepID=A0A0N4UHM6_DRAME|nr:unnamed protein product [Dracunculus medinensis]
MYFRTAHNELEKTRRAHLRNYLDILKDLVPSTANNSRNTTLLLLSRARDHVLVCPFVFISIFFKYLKKIWKKSLFLSSKKEKQYRLELIRIAKMEMKTSDNDSNISVITNTNTDEELSRSDSVSTISVVSDDENEQDQQQQQEQLQQQQLFVDASSPVYFEYSPSIKSIIEPMTPSMTLSPSLSPSSTSSSSSSSSLSASSLSASSLSSSSLSSSSFPVPPVDFYLDGLLPPLPLLYPRVSNYPYFAVASHSTADNLMTPYFLIKAGIL